MEKSLSLECAPSAPRRAEDVRVQKRQQSSQSTRHSVDIELEGSAALVCGGPKCCTTWMQQIVHGLRSRGDMSFEEIIEVMPVLERALNPAYPSLEATQPFLPRAFKTHCIQSQLPKGRHKQIVVTRCGMPLNDCTLMSA